jgi:hypothetical protein
MSTPPLPDDGLERVLVAETPSGRVYAVQVDGQTAYEVFRTMPEVHRCRSFEEAVVCAAPGIRQVWLAPGDVALIGRAWVGAGDVSELACVETADRRFVGHPSCRPGTLVHDDFESLDEGFFCFADLVAETRAAAADAADADAAPAGGAAAWVVDPGRFVA